MAPNDESASAPTSTTQEPHTTTSRPPPPDLPPSTTETTTTPTPTPTPTTKPPHHPLPAPFTNTPPSNIQVITQGAEALVYRTTYLSPHLPVILKYRPPKPYRHPILDRRLTKARILAEARALVRVRKEGVNVPAVLGADWEGGWLVLEFVEGGSVRGLLDGWVKNVAAERGGGGGGVEGDHNQRGVLGLMGRIGREVGKLHDLGVCHGDLTTSNIMVRKRKDTKGSGSKKGRARKSAQAAREDAISGPPPDDDEIENEEDNEDEDGFSGEVVLIDFGLASQATKQSQDEDRAVDLYVLERAFAATHPSAEGLFQEVLRVYGESCGDGRRVLKKLGEVRGRGRKRNMVG